MLSHFICKIWLTGQIKCSFPLFFIWCNAIPHYYFIDLIICLFIRNMKEDLYLLCIFMFTIYIYYSIILGMCDVGGMSWWFSNPVAQWSESKIFFLQEYNHNKIVSKIILVFNIVKDEFNLKSKHVVRDLEQRVRRLSCTQPTPSSNDPRTQRNDQSWASLSVPPHKIK